MNISPRLLAVADLIGTAEVVADIGTDHAYLPVYLIENNLVSAAIASDVRKGPLENAKKTVLQHGLGDKIELRLSDGLKSYKKGDASVFAVAGMGGLLISSFIEDTPWLREQGTRLVLQPMTHAEELRKTLFDCGFSIDREIAVREGTKLYIVISAFYSGVKQTYSDFDIAVGSIRPKDGKTEQEFLEKLAFTYQKKLTALNNAGRTDEKCESILKQLKSLLKGE